MTAAHGKDGARVTEDAGRAALAAGEAAGHRGDLRAAMRHFEQALEENPALAAAHFNLGVCSAALGELRAACEYFGRAAELSPAFAAAHERLGSVRNALGDYTGAARSFRAALKLDPDNAPALAWLGAALQLAGRLDDAEDCYRRALEIDPGNADAHCNLGKLCQATDRPREARAHLEQALSASPGHPAALAGLAMQLDREGRYPEALELLVPHSQSPHPEVIIAHARALRRLGRNEEAATYLEALLGRSALPLDARVQAHFSLGQAFDALGRHADACTAFAQGNRLKGAAWDQGRLVAATDQLMRIFAERGFEHLPRSGNDSETPIFVLGMPRSGKSIVEQVLASHPAVFGAGELTALGSLTADSARELGRAWPECIPDLTGAMLDRMAGRYLDAARALAPDAVRSIDTLPGNFVHIGLIELLFPRARVVHVTRDARDLALACWRKNFAGASLAFTFDFNDIAAYYAEYRRLMAHWREVTSLAWLEVGYEELVRDTESVSSRLVAFAGLPWHGDCLRYFEPGVAKLAGPMAVRERLDARETGSHEPYRAWLDFSAFDAACGAATGEK